MRVRATGGEDRPVQGRGVAALSSIAESPSSLGVVTRTDNSVTVLTVDGALDTANAGALRDSIVKATLGRPFAVIVNITALQVLADAAWSAFLGAHWQLHAHPDIPIVLVSADRSMREALTRGGVTMFLPVYPTEKAATKALGSLARRTIRRADAQLPADLTSLRESRRLVREWLTDWSQTTLIPVALVVVNVFVENVLHHTACDPMMRLQTDGATAAIAVSDGSNAPALRLPSPAQGIDVSGLAIVDALSRAWGSAPTASGKTVWAVIGPENQL